MKEGERTMYPSIKTLMTLGIEREHASTLRKVLDGRLAPQAVDASIEREHVGAPRSFTWEGKLKAADVLLHGHGVEWATYECSRGEYPPRGFEYVNMGDTYNSTLVYVRGRFRVSTFGDEVEAHEKRCAACRKVAREGM